MTAQDARHDVDPGPDPDARGEPVEAPSDVSSPAMLQ